MEVPKAKKIILPVPPNGHWEFPDVMGSKQAFGFVYVIVDTSSNMYYLGRKNYRGDGHLNRGIEHDWRNYTSSSKDLNYLIANKPKEVFRFICIEEYRTKATLAYAETWSLCKAEVPTKRSWHNRMICEVRWKTQEGITPRHLARLNEILAMPGA